MYFKRLKEKWEITSNFQLVVIFIVFAITGSLSVRLGKPILNFFQIDPIRFEDLFMGTFLYWILRILIIFPVYQILLILVGTVFFQYRFFWEFEKTNVETPGHLLFQISIDDRSTHNCCSERMMFLQLHGVFLLSWRNRFLVSHVFFLSFPDLSSPCK